MPVVIRPAAPGDLAAITAIYGPAVRDGTASFELEPPDEAEMRARFERITRRGYPYLVAEENRRVLGYAYANAYRDRLAYRFTVEDSIYVAEDAQGRGIGRQLLEALIRICTDGRFRLMVAVIGDSRQYASITLHRSAGFHFCGTLHGVGYKHGRWLDSVLMERALGPGEAAPPVERG